MRVRKPPEKMLFLPILIENETEQVGDNKNNRVKRVYDMKTKHNQEVLHETCFKPIKSTLIKALSIENFAIWQGITLELIAAHFPKAETTVFVNLDKTRKNLRSTKSEQL